MVHLPGDFNINWKKENRRWWTWFALVITIAILVTALIKWSESL